MIEYIVLGTVLIAFILASYEDIKKREVYDYLNFLFAMIVLSCAMFHSIILSSFDPLKYVLFGMLAGFAFGYLFYYVGLWGGGDTKFLVGFGGSIFYLLELSSRFMSFGPNVINLSAFPELILQLISYVMYFVLFINVLFMFLIILKLLLDRRREEIADLCCLFLILLFFTASLFLTENLLILSLLGFVAFLLMFFTDEEIFYCVYWVRRIPIKKLKEGDRVDEDLYAGKEKIAEQKEVKEGISAGHLKTLSQKGDKGLEVRKRHVIPYLRLIELNLFLLIFKMIGADMQTGLIFLFLFLFLFVSFTAGGVIAVFILFYTYIRNFKKIRMNFTFFDKVIMSLFAFSCLITVFLDFTIFLLCLMLFLIIPFMRLAKATEKFLFVSKKKISQIVPGDWIVEDVKVGNKLIYKKEEFKLGINEKQLEKVKELSKKHRGLDSILVKDGLAFLPPLFIGFLILIFI